MKHIFLYALLLLSCNAISSEQNDYDHMGGVIFSVSDVKYKDFDYESDKSYNANLVAFFPSLGFEYVDSELGITNVFLGMGLSNLIQFQVGTGSEGRLTRVRSDLFVFNLFNESENKFPFMFPNRKHAKWFQRLTLSMSLTEYETKYIGKQLQIGVGLTF